MGHYDEFEEKLAAERSLRNVFKQEDCIAGDSTYLRKHLMYNELSKIVKTYTGYTGEIPPELFHFIEVLVSSHKNSKYPADNWLQTDGRSISRKNNFASISRHVASDYAGDPIDDDSGLHHTLHAATRLMMSYTRRIRNIKHVED